MTPEEKQQFDDFRTWQQQRHNAESLFHNMAAQKAKLDTSEPMAIPRGYVIAGIIALTALIVASFPILLFGVAFGAFLHAKIAKTFKIK